MDAVFPAATPTVDLVMTQALRAVRTHLDLEVAFISEFVNGRRVFRYVDAPEGGFNPLAVGASDPLQESFCQRVVDGRLPGLMQDATQNAEACSLPVTRQMPIGAHLSVPIRLPNELQVFGTFCCFGRQPRPELDERDLAVLRLFADFVGQILVQPVQQSREKEARRARIQQVLDARQFHVVFQPIVHLGKHQVVGHEVLTRFTVPPQRPPDQWFAEAASVGLQARLEWAVMQEALEGFEQVPEGNYLSFNVSPQTLLNGDLLERLAAYPLDRIMLELTEHVSIEDYGVVADKLAPLRRCGLLLAVDDAGAGYASFRHILRLKPDVIKLDASLVASIDTNEGARALAAAVVRFAEETGSKVVAEGVETEQELQVLRQLKVNHAQGYLLGRPGPLSGRA